MNRSGPEVDHPVVHSVVHFVARGTECHCGGRNSVNNDAHNRNVSGAKPLQWSKVGVREPRIVVLSCRGVLERMQTRLISNEVNWKSRERSLGCRWCSARSVTCMAVTSHITHHVLTFNGTILPSKAACMIAVAAQVHQNPVRTQDMLFWNHLES